MDVGKGVIGWERVTPIEDHPELSCEMYRLSGIEKMELSEDWRNEEGDIIFKFVSARSREVFAKYVRKIVGLKYDGKEVNQPDFILGPDMPPDDGIVLLIAGCAEKFWEMNFLSEDEIKNSSKPSSQTGSKAAKKGKEK